LDDPSTASPAGWSRGGSDSSIDQVTTANSVSPTHSLSLVDTNFGYGEWYQFLPLCGIVAGDTLEVQFFRIYNISDLTGATNASMRLSLAFIDANGFTITNTDFNAFGQSPGWTGSVATSPSSGLRHLGACRHGELSRPAAATGAVTRSKGDVATLPVQPGLWPNALNRCSLW